MSIVTNILLYLSAENKKVEQVNSFFIAQEDRLGHPSLVSVDDARLPRRWYGGTKGLEADIYVGAFNGLDVQGFIDHLQAIDWEEDEVVQLFLKEQEDMEFRLIDISRWLSD